MSYTTSPRIAIIGNALQDAFNAHSNAEGENYRLGGADTHTRFHKTGSGHMGIDNARPEIDRTVLRRLLTKWGHAFVSATSRGDGARAFAFANGAVVECAVVGGAYSFPPCRRSMRPIGVNGVKISLAPAPAGRADMADMCALVEQEMLMNLERGSAFGAQRNGDRRIRAYACFRGPEKWTVPATPDDVRAELQKRSSDYAPVLLKLVDHCDDAAIYQRAFYALLIGRRWAHVDGVTTLGDAAHLMPPFAGAGRGVDGEAAIIEWETRMTASAAKWAQATMDNAEAFTNPNAPQKALEPL
ncbi:FAD/NAD(P)-binding domain-containing protein [Epithele typhae]|uniref:FAD/NAD(P)-binding domain-containing protein n=1 Tax=Epithele typhae TaxID=378194 RepID=UPI002007A9A1|nr:FAD/NAD(P)-binding domain-containing protein [Epithele typhae]KAH9931646.1 FAD/NAD(P)-binding domain-containing protein [Epithele typhae]